MAKLALSFGMPLLASLPVNEESAFVSCLHPHSS